MKKLKMEQKEKNPLVEEVIENEILINNFKFHAIADLLGKWVGDCYILDTECKISQKDIIYIKTFVQDNKFYFRINSTQSNNLSHTLEFEFEALGHGKMKGNAVNEFDLDITLDEFPFPYCINIAVHAGHDKSCSIIEWWTLYIHNDSCFLSIQTFQKEALVSSSRMCQLKRCKEEEFTEIKT